MITKHCLVWLSSAELLIFTGLSVPPKLRKNTSCNQFLVKGTHCTAIFSAVSITLSVLSNCRYAGSDAINFRIPLLTLGESINV